MLVVVVRWVVDVDDDEDGCEERGSITSTSGLIC